MPTFRAADETELAYHVQGTGAPLICLPGGPMRAAAYLSDLGGLSARRQLIMLDLRGTGESAIPADPASYRCDRVVDDARALQDHLGLDQADLLGHSAGANIAVQYAQRYPHRISKLALVTPSVRAVGLVITGQMRQELMLLRKGEPWYPVAEAAFERIDSGLDTEADWQAMAPFAYGRWDAVAQAHNAAGEQQTNSEAAEVFIAEGAFDPPATRAALATFSPPVLLFAGEVDVITSPRVAAEFAALIPAAQLVIQPGAGHYPWLDDASWFTSAVAGFLDGA